MAEWCMAHPYMTFWIAMAEKRRDNKGRVLRLGESQRKDGSYMYRFTDSNKKRQTIYAPSLAELRTKEKDLSKRESMGLNYDAKKLTVSELIKKHIDNKRPSLKPLSIRQYESALRQIDTFPFSKIVASEVRVSTARDFVGALRARGYSDRSIRQLTALVQAAFTILVEDDIIPKNPFQTIKLVSSDIHTREALTPEEQKDLIDFVKKKYPQHLPLVTVLLNTGVRSGELCGITISDIDFENRKLHIQRQVQGVSMAKLRVAPPKTKAGIRSIPINDDAYNALKQAIRHTKEFKTMPFLDGTTGFVFLTSRGQIGKCENVGAYIRMIRDDYNETNGADMRLSPHILRHTYCTNLIRGGADIKAVQYLMGHSHADVTLNVYSHYRYEDAEQSLRKVGII